jgi:hypothetical protein
MIRLHGDFNGYWDDHLCLSHDDHATDEHGSTVELKEGMYVLAFELDSSPNEPTDYLVLTGTIVHSPESMSCNGSRWAVRADPKGLRHVASLNDV